MRYTARSLMAGLITLCATAGQAQMLETSARAAYVYDQTTGTVLLAKDAEIPLPPASMSKLMTIYMAFEAIADGRLSVDDILPVSAHAASFGGSSMFLDTTDRVRVEDLLRGVIVLSGNDASVVLAEALSPDGTEAGFGRMMTDRARQLGMTQSVFVNASGWPAAGHRMSVKDLGILSSRLISDFPTFYPLFSETEFAFDNRVPSNSQNRNPILAMGIGADGLKTGHTEASGYGLTASVKRGDRRLIMVINGLESVKARADESQRLVEWGFREFDNYQLFTAGETVTQADVWLGDMATVPLVIKDDLAITLPRSARRDMKVTVTYEGPLPAPISAGTQVATLHVTVPDMAPVSMPLVTGTEVGQLDFMGRISSAIGHIVWGAAGG